MFSFWHTMQIVCIFFKHGQCFCWCNLFIWAVVLWKNPSPWFGIHISIYLCVYTHHFLHGTKPGLNFPFCVMSTWFAKNVTFINVMCYILCVVLCFVDITPSSSVWRFSLTPFADEKTSHVSIPYTRGSGWNRWCFDGSRATKDSWEEGIREGNTGSHTQVSCHGHTQVNCQGPPHPTQTIKSAQETSSQWQGQSKGKV